MGSPTGQTTGSTAPGGTGTGSDRLAYHRFAAEMLRARGVLLIACGLWLLVGGALDLYAFPILGRGSISVPLLNRVGATAFHVAVLAMLFRSPLPPPRLTIPVVAALFPLTSFTLGVISTRVGGLTSPYHAGTFVILMAQALAIPQHWRRGAVLAFLTAALTPATVLGFAGFDPVLRAQLDDPHAVAAFVTVSAVLGAAAVVVAWGGHIVWSLRQSVFESKSIGRYRLLRRIGKGGMGEVWRALDKATRHDVALKILSPEHGKDPAAIARFEREIQATAELAHPNVVRIHDWGVTDDGVWYYAMELLDGVDLGTLVRRHGPLPAEVCVHLGRELCRAIALAHGRGIVHRDLKPGNVFVVSPTGAIDRVKVLDFGVARVRGADDIELTHAGAVMGTPGFIAPEVAAGAPAGVPADVYGLAATLFYALTGRNPRDAGGRSPSALVTGVPAALDDAIVAGLDADPGRRPPGVDGLAARLEAIDLARGWSDFRIDRARTPSGEVDVGLQHTAPAGLAESTGTEAPTARGRGA